ncbi:MAG: GNAT family N-acetyltransferase [Rhodospirillales bacterium]|nr:GNAT family N-acetyltransferase [Rhodospirillales bacterium]MBO6785252.1 GNAT family N-acetyltransferase [Rhodospirillales bacterium]
MTLALSRMTEGHRPAVLGLRVRDTQTLFVEQIAATLADTEGTRDNHVMLSGLDVIGFFQIDAMNKPRFQAPSAFELELHEVMIDAGYQGQGFGKAFAMALGGYIRTAYPAWETLVLSVNCRNEHAYALYRLGGFADTGEIFEKGHTGPQNVMRLVL